MDKFEYRMFEFKRGGLGLVGASLNAINEDLNRLGADGWEVITANPMAVANGGTTSIIVILQRKIIS